MGLFKPAWMSKDDAKAVKAVEALTDQNKLSCAVRETPSLKARQLAAQKITDPGILADLAVNFDSGYVHQIIVAKLTDQRALTHLAIHSPLWDVREKAVEKLTDQNTLAYIIQHEKGNNIRLKAAERFANQALVQKVYAQIAKTAEYWTQSVDRTCLRAVELLSDQGLLADVAMHTKDRRIACKAVEKLTDQALLTEVAKNAEDGSVMSLTPKMHAVRKITDQDTLHDLAVNPKYSRMTRKAAFREMTDRMLLREMAEAPEVDLKTIDTQEIRHISDQAALAYIAINNISSHAAGAAAAKVTDPRMCYCVAMCTEWGSSSIKHKLKAFTDTKILTDIAENAAVYDTMKAAKERLDELNAVT